MDERDSHCPYLLSSETTAKGTGLAESAGQEDPVELDSSLALWRHTRRVEHVGGPPGPPVKYHYSYRFLTYPVRRGGEPPAGSRFWCQAARERCRAATRSGDSGRGGRGHPGGFSLVVSSGAGAIPGRDPLRGQWQVGSLTGAVHLSNCNAGVLRRARGGQ